MLISHVLLGVEHITAHKARVRVLRILLTSLVWAVENSMLLLVGLLRIDIDEFVIVSLWAILHHWLGLESEPGLDKGGASLHSVVKVSSKL